jgi:hypothetical protein
MQLWGLQRYTVRYKKTELKITLCTDRLMELDGVNNAEKLFLKYCIVCIKKNNWKSLAECVMDAWVVAPAGCPWWLPLAVAPSGCPWWLPLVVAPWWLPLLVGPCWLPMLVDE